MAEQNGNQTNNTEGQEKTFTQAELDSIVGERLARERAKYTDYEDLKNKATEYDKQQEASKTELQKALEKSEKLQAKLEKMEREGKIKDIRTKVSGDTGVPVGLLSGDDEETCKAQAEAILTFAKDSRYPGVKEQKRESSRQVRHSQEASDDDYRELAGQIFGKKE